MKLQVLNPDHPILRALCDEVSKKELKLARTQKLIEQLLDFVYGTNPKHLKKKIPAKKRKPITVGLSANQVGISKKICVVDLGIGNKNYNDLLVLVNPRIIKRSTKKFSHREGCVNLPSLYGMVERYQWVLVKAWDRSGNEITIKAKGWLSVLLQHEIGHLNGYLFIDLLEDPQKVPFVPDNVRIELKEDFQNWKHFKDMSKVVRSVETSKNL